MDYAAIIAAIGVPLAAIAGAILNHLYNKSKADADADFAKRKLAMEGCNLDDHRADQMSQLVIGKYEARITALETEVVSIRRAWGDEVRLLQKEHQDCLVKYERLLVKIEMIERKQRSE